MLIGGGRVSADTGRPPAAPAVAGGSAGAALLSGGAGVWLGVWAMAVRGVTHAGESCGCNAGAVARRAPLVRDGCSLGA